MLRFINVSRGGHNISLIRGFEEWDVDEFKPDAIIANCPIINEGAMSVVAANTPNTPEVFANRFKDYFDSLKNKSYEPEVIPFVLYIGVQANIVDQSTGEYKQSYINNYGPVDTYRYIGALENTIYEDFGYFINVFNVFDKIAHRKAKLDETNNIWTSAIVGSGTTGNTFTVDNVHLNDYGTMIAYRIVSEYFNI